MELLSPIDIFFFKTVACGAAGYLSYSYLRKYRKRQIEPLIPQKKEDRSKPISGPVHPSRNINKALEQTGKRCIVFYGTETGTAERLATQLSKEAKSRFGLECLVADLDDHDFEDLLTLPNDKIVVFLLATYGEGEPTDNAVSFNRFVRGLAGAQQEDSSLYYAGFGLGNSSYALYNEMIKHVDLVLASNAAHRIGDVGLGDDGMGTLEDEFMEWKETTLPQIAQHFGLTEQAYTYETSFLVKRQAAIPTDDTFLGEPNKKYLRNKPSGPYTLSNPYAAPLLSAREMCTNGPRKFLHIELDLSRSTLSYEAGDHLAIRPVNSDLEVERFLRVFNLHDIRNVEILLSTKDASIKVPIPSPTTYETVARYYLDICASVSRQLLRTVANFASTHNAKVQLQTLSLSSTAFQSHITDRCLNIAQVLELIEPHVPWKDVPFSVLLENVPVMRPRYYSISSSPLMSKKTVSITTVVESTRLPETTENFKGVATNYLLALSLSLQNNLQNPTHQIAGPRQRYARPTALVTIRRSKFKLPQNTEIPIIMIGPGTGVAPFRGFLQTRSQRCKEGKVVGRTMLFYGCRKKDEDFLYANEWQDLQNVMTPGVFSFNVAFSREEGRPKKYVHHLFNEHTEELRDLILRKEAYVYVCGDAKRMARDVFNAMAKVIASDSQFTGNVDKAQNHLISAKASGRWLEDTPCILRITSGKWLPDVEKLTLDLKRWRGRLFKKSSP